MKNTYVGRVVSVGKTETLGKNPAKPFYKRTIVVDDAEIGAKYPNPVPFEATGDKCKYLDGIEAGDTVTVEYYLTGREWTDPKTKNVRYFTSNRIDFIKQGAAEDGGDAFAEAEADAGSAEAQGEDSPADDMPF